MPWGVAAAAVAAGGAIYSANKQSNAANSAAQAQQNAANQASQAELQMFNQNRADQAPFREAGLTGLNQYMAMLGLPTDGSGQYGGGSSSNSASSTPISSWVDASSGVPQMNQQLYYSDPAYKAAWDQAVNDQETIYKQPFSKYTPANQLTQKLQGLYQQYQQQHPATPAASTPSTPQSAADAQQAAFAQFRSTPGYQFGLDEGEKSVQASAAARGGLNSGATLKALTKFGNDYADQQGYTPYMNKLASLAGMAQTSTNQTGQQGTQVAGQIGNNTINAGQARAGGIYGSANAWSNGVNQLSQAAGQAFGSFGSPSSSNYGLGGSGSSAYSGINDGSIGNWNGSLSL